MMMPGKVTYRVIRHKNGEVLAFKVTGDGTPAMLSLRGDILGHAPDFDAGYEGSGPAQLALAIVADALDHDARADAVHQDFKRAVIARLGGPVDGPFEWSVSQDAVIRIVEKIERRGWKYVVEQFDKDRDFLPQFAGHKAMLPSR